jgi:hypothetical protein
LTNEENFKDLAIDDEFFQKILTEHEDGENNEVRINTKMNPNFILYLGEWSTLKTFSIYEKNLNIPRMSK